MGLATALSPYHKPPPVSDLGRCSTRCLADPWNTRRTEEVLVVSVGSAAVC